MIKQGDQVMNGLYDILDTLAEEITDIRDEIPILKDKILNTDIPEEVKSDIVGSLEIAMRYLNYAYYSFDDALKDMEEFINL